MAQINERAELERNARDEAYYNDKKLVDVLAIEEDQFQQYANKVHCCIVKIISKPLLHSYNRFGIKILHLRQE